jgi:hypothetical protein
MMLVCLRCWLNISPRTADVGASIGILSSCLYAQYWLLNCKQFRFTIVFINIISSCFCVSEVVSV